VRLLAQPEPPTAVVCASDLMALGVIHAAHEAGLDVPGDLSVVGFDDAPVAALTRPGLTTVRQDKEAIGRAAGDALLALIEDRGEAAAMTVLPVALCERGTTAPPGARGGAMGAR